MIIQTKYHDEVEIALEDILNFGDGIPGFLGEKEFVILPLAEDISVLQSISSKEIGFIIMSPFTVLKDYNFELDDNIAETLSIEKPEDVTVFNIVSIKEPFNESTMNLVAPVVINDKSKKGKQVILQKTNYSIRTPLQPAAQEQKG